jgi:hypothetical protein
MCNYVLQLVINEHIILFALPRIDFFCFVQTHIITVV